MVKYLVLLGFFSLWFTGPVQTAQQVAHASLLTKTELVSFTAVIREGKIHLRWIVNGNDQLDRFEIEKSADRKKFSMMALVFCSEIKATDQYQITDNSASKKTYYRIKLIHKDGTSTYSQSLEIDPSAKPEPTEQTKTNSHAEYC